ncbi:PLP-dependent transferase [Ascodesmis nigricans]|uniref:PLP-dependent transferase n=1 Tax=Ascodesmis nigricans TaxID=341454 RepID=A0A4S2MXD9_9PEZI|nr:PLP-dependent transferase [Ascodesmis nigricans]
MTDPPSPSPPIDLLRGHPRTSLLPVSPLLTATTSTLTSPLPTDSYAASRHPLHYGPDLGNWDVRVEIAGWVREMYGLDKAEEIAAERVCLTSGASYALGEVLRQCTSPVTGYTRRAFVVTPTYYLVGRVLEDAGFADKMTAVRSLPGGTIDFGFLEKELERLEKISPEVSLEEGLRPYLRPGVKMDAKRIYRHILYCVPTYSNPTGETFSLATRHRLLSLARKYDILIVSDDVYDFLGNVGDGSAVDGEGRLLPRLVTLDARDCDKTGAGNTVSNCSFSKLLGPGLRCGWIESATGKIARIVGEGGANHSGGAPSHFASTLLLPLLRPSLTPPQTRLITPLIHRFRLAYTSTSHTALRAIRTHLPPSTRISGGKGGFFIWLEFPPEIDARGVVKVAREMENGVIVGSGDMSECMGGDRNWCNWGRSCVRISVAYQDEEGVEEGVRRLGEAVRRWRENPIQGEVETGVVKEE